VKADHPDKTSIQKLYKSYPQLHKDMGFTS